MKTEQNNSQQITLHSYTHSPDTGLEHSTSQIHFILSTLYSFSAEIPLSPSSSLLALLYATHTEYSRFISNIPP